MTKSKTTAAEQRRREKIAAEFKEFRQTYLFNQTRLSEYIGCSPRCIGYIEAAQHTPLNNTLRRFYALRERHRHGGEGEEAA